MSQHLNGAYNDSFVSKSKLQIWVAVYNLLRVLLHEINLSKSIHQKSSGKGVLRIRKLQTLQSSQSLQSSFSLFEI